MNVRDKIQLFRVLFTQYDELSETIAADRYKFEMLRMKPELGIKVGRGPDGTPQPHVAIDAEMVRAKLESDADEREVLEKIIITVTNSADLDEAREKYLNLLAAFNRVGKFKEQRSLLVAGYQPFEIDKDEAPTLEQIDSDLPQAEARLAEINAGIEVAPPSKIALI
jgi:hypothetical protein